MKRGFEKVSENFKKNNTETLLPLRGTQTSAGYDFYAPKDLVIRPQEQLMFWTDVKAKIPEGEVLLLDIRSSIGVNNGLMMANTIGIIDSDYYNNPDNDGNIGICIRNLNPNMQYKGSEVHDIDVYDSVAIPEIKSLYKENTVTIKAGERIAQGIFVKYQEAENCNTDKKRTGGIGSTDK